MNKELLTVLGCSSSLALALMTANSAEANNAKEYVFTAPNLNNLPVASETDYPFYDCSCSEYNQADINRIDRQGDQAINLFGCDCAGCRNLVRNLEETPQSAPRI
ncbi:hypothetical protein Sta7437_0569 [Stanieria cyanosphaera PCC 7437]|uniref:Uncharacterized protein n=1 Tax=Stanieria cyanosphaera (strain ATCC 29371 / PCC 7437) TaxID=111780 RepID=K9XNH9_STAC7|nr:hypothetical protein [Stanieria cyanosphaera]AFZ34170.1 hypothetical protein Sta7437_0569 [Stanieria cyanosphaera PCC 7437]